MEEQNLGKPLNQQLDIPAVMRCLLLSVADGKTKFKIDYPKFGKVNVEIISFDFTNIEYKPVKVKILDNLLKEDFVWVDDTSFGGDERNQIKQKVNRKWQEEWCMLDWFLNIA
jgi:hypothetical protein